MMFSSPVKNGSVNWDYDEVVENFTLVLTCKWALLYLFT